MKHQQGSHFVTQKDPDELVHFYRKRTQGKKAGSSVLLKS